MSKHLYKHYFQYALSIQEREVTAHIAKLLVNNGDPFELKVVRDKVAIMQHSHLSAIITRLVNKGVLTRLGRGEYCFYDAGLVEYIKGLKQL